MRKHLGLLAPFAALLLLAGCGTPAGEGIPVGGQEPGGEEPGGEEPGGELEGAWVLVDGVPTVESHPITLEISEGQVGGTAACNSYGGNLHRDGRTFEVSELFQTEKACIEPGVMESESAYLDALRRVDSATVEDGVLILTGGGERLVFEREAPEGPSEAETTLTGTRWRVESLLTGSGPDATASSTTAPATLQLLGQGGAGDLHGDTGCNQIDGTWEREGDILRASDLAITDAECPDGVGQQQEHILEVLAGDMTVELDGSTLVLQAGEVGLQLRAG